MKPLKNDNNGSNNNWLGFSLAPDMRMEANNTPLSVMPLKSDGSLCIMEALSRSQSGAMVLNSSPKLENFLGGATMANHQYGSTASPQRDAMVLSLDSAFYNQEPYRQQNHFYSGLKCNTMYQTTEERPNILEDVFPCLKTWMDQNQVHENQVNNSNNDDLVNDRVVMECGNLQSLTLSMSPGSQSSCVTASRYISPTETNEGVTVETRKRGLEKIPQKQTVHRKSIDTFGQRTSQYRGVTRHRWTGRYEAHLWDNSCKKEGQTRKGRQGTYKDKKPMAFSTNFIKLMNFDFYLCFIFNFKRLLFLVGFPLFGLAMLFPSNCVISVYLGGYDMEEKAARAYDLAALKYWGASTHINFPLENYHHELEEMKNMTRQEHVAHLRRRSSGFSRGASMYRGVTRHHQHGRWQARIGRVAGNKDLYLGTFSTQEEAAEAYDIAAIKFRGANAVTNFDISRYAVEKIMASNTLPTGEIARRNNDREPNVEVPAIEYNTAVPGNAECVQVKRVGNIPDWKIVLHNKGNPTTEPNHERTMNIENYQNSPFSFGLHDLICIDSSHSVVDESGTHVIQHLSNPSSLVTSLSSSREASPDRKLTPIVFANLGSSKINSWIPTAQLRPVPLTMAQLPVFASWDDARM
ncbi:AP2-like ethylene-responsive transcription factor ANT isoform X1 [Primulina huaijiensis]|uniref:AP2-like ethylene-responsive transcription factor ANT isoform X1 n=1 Tax=Primulina huaijiensis TaxID=1492673 RepID=UPI003CC6E228